MRIVVEGCGQWAMQYLQALRELVTQDDGVFFTYDSTFGLDFYTERLPARLFSGYLQATLRNAEGIKTSGFACLDLKDTVFRLKRIENNRRSMLPHNVEAVFVVTPDRTHCEVATYWLGRARRIFVEKPFDTSTERIRELCDRLRSQNSSEVFAVDHYLVRCNQAASEDGYFLRRLLAEGDAGEPLGDISAFEFRMTEPPAKDYTSLRERALSLQTGMIFDMASHALPVLSPFIDIMKPMKLTAIWAGVSNGLQDIIFSGAETFSAARVECQARRTGQHVTGEIVIGKDVGDRAEKFLLLEGPAGKVRFDLLNYHVYHERPGGDKIPLVPLQQDWVRFFLKEVMEGRTPMAVRRFQPEGALRVIEFLETWRQSIQRAEPLANHQRGSSLSSLRINKFRLV
jgi:predicted dehydrogenase